MNLLRLYRGIATLGPIGYLAASGTVATLVTVPMVLWLRLLFPTQYGYGLITCVITLVSFFVINRALADFKRQEDPSEIVLDEVVGCLITFWGISMQSAAIIIGLVLFRFLSIVKIGIFRYREPLGSVWGIMFDDIIAALVSNILLRLIF